MVRHLQVNVGYCNVKASGLQGRFNHEETEKVNKGNTSVAKISFGLRICIALVCMCMCVMCMTSAIQKTLSYVTLSLHDIIFDTAFACDMVYIAFVFGINIKPHIFLTNT